MARETQTVTIRFRARPRDLRRLTKLAKRFEVTPSAMLRRLIADETARVLGIVKVTKESNHGSEEK